MASRCQPSALSVLLVTGLSHLKLIIIIDRPKAVVRWQDSLLRLYGVEDELSSCRLRFDGQTNTLSNQAAQRLTGSCSAQSSPRPLSRGKSPTQKLEADTAPFVYRVFMPTCLTVFADASFDRASGIAAFAGWFRTDGSVHKISKVSERRFASSNEAELVALCATVLVALSHQRSFGDGDFVVAKSDCTYAVEHLKNSTGGTTETERRIVAKVHDTLLAHGLKFYVRHVKGHTTLTEPRFHVNRWCDGEARRLMRETVRKRGQNNKKRSNRVSQKSEP